MLVGAVASLAVCGAYAEGGYVGASIGQSNFEDDDFDDSSAGFKLFGGYKFNKNFAVEGYYIDFGEVEDEFLGFDIDVEATGFGGSAVGILPVNEQFAVFGKAGLLLWDAEASVSDLDLTEDDDGTDLILGVGASFMFNEQFAIRGEWEFVDLDDTEVDMLSIGGQFNF